MNNIYRLKQITTPQLIIRPIQLGDEIPLSTAINNSLASLQQWMPWAKDTSLKATQTFVRQAVFHWQSQQGNAFPMVVIHKADQKIIGASGYTERSTPIKAFYEIGYWLDMEYQGQGLATECVNALTRYALDAIGANRVQLRMQIENTKSVAVAKRCGFKCEATIRHNNLDCYTHLPVDGLLYACCSTALLPPLDIAWTHDDKINEHNINQVIDKANKQPSTLPILKTERLQLIPPREQDTDASYHTLMGSLDEIAPRFSWAHQDLTLEEHHAHIKQGAQAALDIHAHDHLFFFVWDQAEKELFGEVWFKILDWSLPSISISYWFGSPHTGQGYATEAVIALIKYAFTALKAKRIQLEISEQNHKSLKLAKRLGFTHEGTLKNYCKNFVTGEVMNGKLFAIKHLLQISDEFAQLNRKG